VIFLIFIPPFSQRKSFASKDNFTLLFWISASDTLKEIKDNKMKGLNYKNIPNRLRKFRKARGLKQKEVAEVLGIKNPSMISRWEKSLCLPSALNIFKLALVYRTLVDTLFNDLLITLREGPL